MLPEVIVDHLAVVMFFALIAFMFIGYPVAFLLGAVGVFFGLIGMAYEMFDIVQFANLLPRLFGQAVQNQVLVAVPMFIFMGTMLEKSRVAEDLLYTLQVLLRRVPGGLAIAVTLLGTIMAATTGIVGASVIMLTLIALPAMMERQYSKELSVGVIASAGTLGILIPPSIMLVIMGDLISLSVGSLFMAAVIPGVMLSALYVVYIMVLAKLKPQAAPSLSADDAPANKIELLKMVFRSFVPPMFLIVLVLGSIFAGWATPTEASGVGALGAILLAWFNKQLNMKVFKEVMSSSALTNSMVFFIIFGATLFSYVFRALGGDDVVVELLEVLGLTTGWEVLTFVMVLVFIMGFFFDWIEICLIVIPVFGPILGGLDFGGSVPNGQPALLWFSILLATNMQSAFLTPPFGFALFYMKGTVPKEITMMHIYRGIIPFVLIQLFAVAMCMIYPDLVLYLPRSMGLLD